MQEWCQSKGFDLPVYKIIEVSKKNGEPERFSEIIRTQNISVIQVFNQAFIHSSEDKIKNYEKLEFLGDAVLRLAASNFIEKKYPQMNVGERSELRAQIVSDEW